LKYINFKNNKCFFKIKFLYGDWGLGIGDWGLGIGDWAQSPIPNPHFHFINILLCTILKFKILFFIKISFKSFKN